MEPLSISLGSQNRSTKLHVLQRPGSSLKAIRLGHTWLQTICPAGGRKDLAGEWCYNLCSCFEAISPHQGACIAAILNYNGKSVFFFKGLGKYSRVARLQARRISSGIDGWFPSGRKTRLGTKRSQCPGVSSGAWHPIAQGPAGIWCLRHLAGMRDRGCHIISPSSQRRGSETLLGAGCLQTWLGWICLGTREQASLFDQGKGAEKENRAGASRGDNRVKGFMDGVLLKGS